jgi:hypothetical protein
VTVCSRARVPSPVQFAYGEDGVDVVNTCYLTQFGFLAKNADRLATQCDLQRCLRVSEKLGLSEAEAKVRKVARQARSSLTHMRRNRIQSPPLRAFAHFLSTL